VAELIVDGYDLANISLTLEDPPNAFDGVNKVHKSAPLPGRNGDVPLARAGQGQAARFDTLVWIKGTDHADFRAKLDALRWRLKGGRPVTLSLPDETTRYWDARLENPAALAIAPPMVQTKHRLRLRWLLLDPYAYSVTPTSVNFVGGETDMPMGTGPIMPTVTLVGAGGGGFTDVTLRARTNGGTLIQDMVLQGTVGSGETLIANCRDGTITLEGANAASFLVAGNYLLYDPSEHADFPGSDWPTIQAVSIGSGSISAASASYKRAWE